MKKKFSSSGNGWQLYLNKSLLRLFGYNPKQIKVKLTAQDEYIIVEPIPIESCDEGNDEYLMIRKLQKSGGAGYGIYFPNALIEYLEVDPETDDLDIKISDGKMFIKKA